MNARIYRNIGWNTAFLGLQTFASLAAVPLLLRSSGDVGFGIYSFFVAVVAVGVLVQAGIDLAIARSVARFSATGDRPGLHADLSFGYLFGVVAGVAQAAIVLVLPQIPGVVDPANHRLATVLSLVFATSALLNAPLLVPLGMLVGLERFALRNSIMSFPVLTGLAVAFLVHSQPPRPGWVIVYAASVEGTRFLGGCFALRRADALLEHLAWLSREQLWRPDLLRFQLKQMGNQVADYLFYTSDRLILQTVVGAVAVAHYSIADRPNTLAQQIVSTPLVALLPSLAAAAASADHGYIRRTVTAGSRVYLALTLPALITLLVCAPELITRWVGPGYADSGRVAQFFVLCLVTAAPFKVYSHYRLAEGSIGVMTATKLGFAPVNALASIMLAQHIGLLGVVLPTAFFYLALYPGVWLVSMAHRGEVLVFLKAVSRSVVVGVAFFWLALGLRPFLPALAGPVLIALAGFALFATLGGGLAAFRSSFTSSNPESNPTSNPESNPAHRTDRRENLVDSIIGDSLRQAARVKSRAIDDLGPLIAEAADRLGECLAGDGRGYIVGNGGSAADAQHFAAEFTGRFRSSRRPLPVVALTTDTSALTSIANDYGFDHVFARQIEALGRPGDVLFALSTSGSSSNVVLAAQAARRLGVTVIALTGARGGALAEHADLLLPVPSPVTARVQECQMTVLHIICDLTERSLGVSEIEPLAHTRAGSHEQMRVLREKWRRDQLTVVSTNGCFDLLHAGHLDSLTKASRLGDVLVVLANSDDSVRRLKGPSRPVNVQADRVALLSALGPVDYVYLFEEDDPSAVLDILRPDIHCKGAEYASLAVPEAAVVERHGGRMHYLPRAIEVSSSRLLERLDLDRVDLVSEVVDVSG